MLQPLLRRLALISALGGAGCGFVLALLTVCSVAGRALWSRPIPGDVELSQFGLGLCIALCLPWCQLRRSNLIIDFFTQGLASGRRQWLDGAGALLLATMLALMAWRTAAGAISVREAGEVSMILGLPTWLGYAALVPGLALTALIALHQAARELLGGGAGRLG